MRSLGIALLSLLSFAGCEENEWRTRVSGPLAAIAGEAMLVEGVGFGTRGPGRWLLVESRHAMLMVSSLAAEVEVWEPSRIVVRLPAETRSGSLLVRGRHGLSRPVPLDVFVYDWFDLPKTRLADPFPLDVTVDSYGQVWVLEQFHLDFHVLDPATGRFRSRPIPLPPNPGVFAGRHDRPTQGSALGEKILVDPEGRIWLTQGGETLYSGPLPNHSRIVSFDPAAPRGQRYRVFNVPGDHNEVIGLAWDPVARRMWFSQAGRGAGAALVSFDPETIPFDNHFDFSVSLDGLVCGIEEPDHDCYRFHWLPDPLSHPSHLVIDDRGLVWYTNFWGDSIGVLDPATGVVVEYPLPERISEAWASQYVGCGPWQIALSPQGDVVFNEFFDSTLGRFRMERLGDPACLTLDHAGRNPCIEERVVPGADPVHQNVHSIAYDPRGNLWFTQGALVESDASLGFVTPDWQHVVRLPPLSPFPARAVASSAGIAVDPENGDIWFAEFLRKRLGHLRRLD